MMYKSQFQKMDLYDWFCGPGSHMCNNHEVKSLDPFFGNQKITFYVGYSSLSLFGNKLKRTYLENSLIVIFKIYFYNH